VPALPTGECHVWWADVQPLPEPFLALLNAVETERAGRFVALPERDRFVMGCVVSRLALGRYLDLSPAEVPLRRVCPQCGGPHGRPEVEGSDIQVSVTHSAERVLVAFCRGGRVGVDVERVRTDLDTAGLARMVLSAVERGELAGADPQAATRAFFTYWSRKEALLKAAGCGLRKAMTELAVSPPGAPARLLWWTGEPAVPPDPVLLDLDAGEGWAAALALLDTTGPVRHHQARDLLGLFKSVTE
jgi:4'-phosphopantetheinyl transferase